MANYRLNESMESRIHREVYVRFGGELSKSRHSNMKMGVGSLAYVGIHHSMSNNMNFRKIVIPNVSTDLSIFVIIKRLFYIRAQRYNIFFRYHSVIYINELQGLFIEGCIDKSR